MITEEGFYNDDGVQVDNVTVANMRQYTYHEKCDICLEIRPVLGVACANTNKVPHGYWVFYDIENSADRMCYHCFNNRGG